MSTPARQTTLARAFAAVVTWAGANPLIGLTLGGLFVYGALRLDYSLFYGRFGIKPEDVGLGYGEVLSQSVAGLVAYAVFLLVISVLLRPHGFIGIRGTGPIRFFSLRPVLVGVALVVSALLILAFVLVIRTDLFDLAFAALGAAGGASLIALFGHEIFALGNQPRTRLESWRAALRAWIPPIVIYTLLAASLSALADGAKVHTGHSTHLTFLGIPVTAWGADRASLNWIAKPPSEYSQWAHDCLMYLGQANGTTILYDVASARTIRLATGDVVVLIAPGGSCRPSKQGAPP
jgi:hypothetical protein